MSVGIEAYLVALPLIFLAACIDAIGGGGGLISLPAYLVAGLPSTLASGSNKLSASVGTVVSAVKYVRGGKVLMKPALCAAALAAPGSFFGAALLSATPDGVYRALLLIVIPVLALLTLFARGASGQTREMTRGRLALCALVGLACGFYDGFFGPGTGVLLILGFSWIAGMDAVTASGSSKLVNLCSNAVALIVHLVNGNVLFALALPAALTAAAGGYVGAALTLKRGARLVRVVMVVVMLGLLIKLAAEYL